MMEPQQSPLYAQYMKRLKWDVVTAGNVQIFIKKFLFIGGIAKIHRPAKLPSIPLLLTLLKTHGIKRLVIEPIATEKQSTLSEWCKKLPSTITLNSSPYLPTKTIHIKLTQDLSHIFQSFSEAKRRAVRRAKKLGIIVKQSENIQDLIRVKNASAGWFGFVTTSGLKELWETFSPANAMILLAYSSKKTSPIGGVLLIFWDGVAYYWIAGATKEGKKYFAPTILAHEAMILAKSHGAHTFDFVGVWDERIPKENTSWKGFTKFKEGFGGSTVYYPLVNMRLQHDRP